jgi:hypothetical protein
MPRIELPRIPVARLMPADLDHLAVALAVAPVEPAAQSTASTKGARR